MVLTYHRISDQPDFQDTLKVSLENFEKQIIFLKKNFLILSGDDVANIIKSNLPFPKNSCLITFDDGWRDNYIHAFPVLKKYGVPVLIFISTDYIGTKEVFWHERLIKNLEKMPPHFNIEKYGKKWSSELSNRIIGIFKSPPDKRRVKIHELIIYLKSFDPEEIRQINQDLECLCESGAGENNSFMLSWDEVQEMSQSNIVFGSHTKSHVILTQIGADKIKEELVESKKNIEHKLNRPVYFLSYPNGDYNDLVIRLAKEAEYLASFTCLPGVNVSPDRPMELKRKHVNEDFSLDWNGHFSELFFKAELSGIRSYLKSWRKIEKY